MDDKQLFQKLKRLQSVQPRADWRQSQREVLVSQIYGNSAVEAVTFDLLKTIKLPLQIVKSISQPAMVVFIMSFVALTGYLGVKASQNTVPGDSMYIAKLAGEKTQQALTFDDKQKARLGIEIASRRAQEINQVIKNETNVAKKEQDVLKLAAIFQREIADAKSKITQMDQNKTVLTPTKTLAVNKTAPVSEVKTATTAEVKNPEVPVAEADPTVFSANSGREENGIQISLGKKDNGLSLTQTEKSIGGENATPTPTVVTFGNPQFFLDLAKELLDAEDYTGSLTKLDEAGQAVSEAIGASTAAATGTTEYMIQSEQTEAEAATSASSTLK